MPAHRVSFVWQKGSSSGSRTYFCKNVPKVLSGTQIFNHICLQMQSTALHIRGTACSIARLKTTQVRHKLLADRSAQVKDINIVLVCSFNCMCTFIVHTCISNRKNIHPTVFVAPPSGARPSPVTNTAMWTEASRGVQRPRLEQSFRHLPQIVFTGRFLLKPFCNCNAMTPHASRHIDGGISLVCFCIAPLVRVGAALPI